MGTDWKTSRSTARSTPPRRSAPASCRSSSATPRPTSGETVTDAVITVPAYFDDAERQATKEAGEIAGLNVLRIVNEPTAAARLRPRQGQGGDHPRLRPRWRHLRRLLLEVGKDPDDGFATIQVKATSGDNQLGGDDWDDRIVQHLAGRRSRTTPVSTCPRTRSPCSGCVTPPSRPRRSE